jgi:hypothetical protein
MRVREVCKREIERKRHSKGSENAGRVINFEGLKGLGVKDSLRLLQK